MIFGPLVRFGLSILGTKISKMATILDLVNKAWTYVAELYFIGFVDPQNISLGTKSIFLAGLEIEISQKLDLVTGHGGHFEKRIFFIVWTLLERVTRSNIFPHIKIYQKKSRNLICLIWRRKIIFFKWPKDYVWSTYTKSYMIFHLTFWPWITFKGQIKVTDLSRGCISLMVHRMTTTFCMKYI